MKDELLPFAIIGTVLLIIGLFKLCLLVNVYLNADTVKCNLLWCEFTQKRTDITTRITQECFLNGIKINCSDIP